MKRNKSIELSALRVFASIANSATLTEAAHNLGITQSAVSQALKQLEDTTEVDLVIRRSHPIKLTRAGTILSDYASKVLSENSRVLNEVMLADSGGLSNLNVGMIDSFAEALGLQYIAKITPLSSKVGLSTGYQTSLTDALANRDIDVLITSDPESNLPQHSWRTILRDPFLVIAPEASLHKQQVSIEEIAATLPFIHYDPRSVIGTQTDLIARRIGVHLNTRYELDSTQTLLRFVRANYGWAIVSALCIARYQWLLEGVRIINLDNGANARYISQVSRKNELGDLPEKFAAIARSIFSEEITPKLNIIAPWLAEQAYPVTQRPLI